MDNRIPKSENAEDAELDTNKDVDEFETDDPDFEGLDESETDEDVDEGTGDGQMHRGRGDLFQK